MSATTERTAYTPDWLREALSRSRATDNRPKEPAMTFSFSLKARNSDDLAARALEKMGLLAQQQPDHAHDAALVHDTVLKYSKTLHPNDDEAIVASVYGGIATVDGRVRMMNVGVSVAITGIDVL